jgi:hypothetical protein
MTGFVGDSNHGGLPRPETGDHYLWLLEIECFPPINIVITSPGNIAKEAFAELGRNSAVKKVAKRYLALSKELEKVPSDFFKLPCNLISLAPVPFRRLLPTLTKWQSLVNFSVNAIPDSALRWPFVYDLKSDQLAAKTQHIGVYEGTRDVYVASLDRIRTAHEANASFIDGVEG